MFLTIGIALLLFSLFEVYSKRDRKWIFLTIIIALSLLLCVRYGQGTDYFAYNYLYVKTGNLVAELSRNVSEIHGETLWRVIQSLFVSVGMPFEVFVAIIALITSYFTYLAINRYSPYKVFSIFLLYPTYYLTYYYSAFRQGLIIAIFLGCGVNLLLKKRTAKYIILIFALSLIHIASLALLLIPLTNYLNIKTIKKIRWKKIIPIAIVLILLTAVSGIGQRVGIYVIAEIKYYFSFNISILAILERTILFCAIYYFHNYKSKKKPTETEALLYKVYSIGYILFMLLLPFATPSQRITAAFKSTEILIIPIITKRLFVKRKNELGIKIQTAFIVILAITSVATVKNINTILYQGKYNEDIKIYNLKAVTIFNKKEIYNIRHSDVFMNALKQ